MCRLIAFCQDKLVVAILLVAMMFSGCSSYRKKSPLQLEKSELISVNSEKLDDRLVGSWSTDAIDALREDMIWETSRDAASENNREIYTKNIADKFFKLICLYFAESLSEDCGISFHGLLAFLKARGLQLKMKKRVTGVDASGYYIYDITPLGNSLDADGDNIFVIQFAGQGDEDAKCCELALYKLLETILINGNKGTRSDFYSYANIYNLSVGQSLWGPFVTKMGNHIDALFAKYKYSADSADLVEDSMHPRFCEIHNKELLKTFIIRSGFLDSAVVYLQGRLLNLFKSLHREGNKIEVVDGGVPDSPLFDGGELERSMKNMCFVVTPRISPDTEYHDDLLALGSINYSDRGDVNVSLSYMEFASDNQNISGYYTLEHCENGLMVFAGSLFSNPLPGPLRYKIERMDIPLHQGSDVASGVCMSLNKRYESYRSRSSHSRAVVFSKDDIKNFFYKKLLLEYLVLLGTER